MAYAIRFKSSAQRDWERLPRGDQERLAGRIEALANDPRPHNIEPFKGVPQAYRFRVGDLRVVFHVDDAARVVRVLAVGHRKDVYHRR